MNVLRTGVLQGMRLPAVWPGFAAAVVAALALAKSMLAQLFGVDATDPSALVLVLLGFALSAGAACRPPARRSARVEPVLALRDECPPCSQESRPCP